jgi:hypothetical protein
MPVSYLTARKRCWQIRNEFFVQLICHSEAHLRGMGGRKGSFYPPTSPPPPPSHNVHQQNERIIFVRILFVVLTFYLKILPYIKSKPVLLKLYDFGLIMLLYTFQENFPSNSDSNMPFLHVTKRTIISCLASTYLLFCGSLFLIAENVRSLRCGIKDERFAVFNQRRVRETCCFATHNLYDTSDNSWPLLNFIYVVSQNGSNFLPYNCFIKHNLVISNNHISQTGFIA